MDPSERRPTPALAARNAHASRDRARRAVAFAAANSPSRLNEATIGHLKAVERRRAEALGSALLGEIVGHFCEIAGALVVAEERGSEGVLSQRPHFD